MGHMKLSETTRCMHVVSMDAAKRMATRAMWTGVLCGMAAGLPLGAYVMLMLLRSTL